MLEISNEGMPKGNLKIKKYTQLQQFKKTWTKKGIKFGRNALK